jgi:hypothetical protein
VVEIKGSHELGGSQGKGPRVGCSKSRSHEIARSKDSHWIQRMRGPSNQEPHRLSHVWGFGGRKESFSTSQVAKC